VLFLFGNQSVSNKNFLPTLGYFAIPGALLGTFLAEYVSGGLLRKIFGGMLVTGGFWHSNEDEKSLRERHRLGRRQKDEKFWLSFFKSLRGGGRGALLDACRRRNLLFGVSF